MVMTYKAALAAGLVATVGLTAAAQERLQFQRDDVIEASEQVGFGVIAVDPIDMGNAVFDAPFTADAVTEVTQVLADGNRIEQRTSASIARNGEGRTRREQSGIALGTFMAPSAQPMVTITDPKSGVHLTLNYDQKIAYRMKPMRMKMSGPSSPGDPTVTYGTAGVMATRSSDTVIATPAFEAGRRVGGMPPPPPPPPGAFEMAVAGPMMKTSVAGMAFQWDGNARTESLEPRDIEGVRAEGTRTVMTIPAGSMGNALPIEIVNERWMSPELKVVLLTRRFDPRFGETIYRLTNIIRGEPSADLFKVPADFKTEDVRP